MGVLVVLVTMIILFQNSHWVGVTVGELIVINLTAVFEVRVRVMSSPSSRQVTIGFYVNRTMVSVQCLKTSFAL